MKKTGPYCNRGMKPGCVIVEDALRRAPGDGAHDHAVGLARRTRNREHIQQHEVRTLHGRIPDF